ncbi:ABC transporter ATP-binding protein [Niveibacterium umoris]|uniref:Putative ABC transport system ATP-binding protein n=1 Tax=Niveibacterium umoris TaxID=1193620 RepID=A0A840BKF6_9RHOO|nr:ABC transporter ATP-binding protein [Niveibacterium umoris]MBB4014041.1 putative ABC transport system ATP-binding protein [Niveibacterium umoris]
MNTTLRDSTPVVAMRGVSKAYRLGAVQVPALHAADVDVRSGEMVALTGPSGSGKSTLLHIAGLIDTADAGSYALAGTATMQLDETRRTHLRRNAIGFVFQSFNLVPVMTVAENVEYPLFLDGMPRREARDRVAAMLARVGLADRAKHRPDELSGGQRQRVAIARALVKQPRLLIADEPTANLDSHTADEVIAVIRELCHEAGTACLIATHDDRLTAHCDRVLALRDGAIQ